MIFQRLALCALVALSAACKTDCQSAALKGDLTGDAPPAGAADAADVPLATFNGTHWQAEFEPGQGPKIAIDLKIAQGSGTLALNADGQSESHPFASLRFATEGELKEFREHAGKDALDSQGAVIPIAKALVLVGADGAMVTMLPVLHPAELYVAPMGVLPKAP